MRISISYNGNSIIEFNQVSINGRKAAGGYVFGFALRGSRNACQAPISIFDIRLSLSLSDINLSLLTAVPSSNQLVQCNQYPNNSEQVFFEFTLSKEQIIALEDNRQHGDLKLTLGLKALLTGKEGLYSSFQPENVVISREDWLEALNNSGFRKTLLFEIPLPAVSDELLNLLDKAQQFIETGHYQDSVMQCRRIVECIEQVRSDRRCSIDANNKAHGVERQDMSAIERLMSLREQLKNICQLGAHGIDQFTRSQARTVLGMTMLLLAEPTVGFSKSIKGIEELRSEA